MSKEQSQWHRYFYQGLAIALLASPPLLAQTTAPVETKKDDLLHVASPVWQDQIIYFLLTDRFADGDSSNNDQGAGEYDPANDKKYHGGDLKGIADKIDYLEDLGVTAVWITPPVANMWWDPTVSSAGYHGYWAENFREVDKHLGSLETMQNLARTLHGRGMYLIQDIVCNHVGNFFYYKGPYDPKNPGRHFKSNTKAAPHGYPTQKPFDQNDATDRDDRKAAIYHFTPDIVDMNDTKQVLNYQLNGLDDLNTRNPVVRNALKDSYAYWIKEAGIDGFRLDSVIHTTRDFWIDFLHSTDLKHPGVKVFAKSLGKDDFFSFGEVWQNATPYDDNPDKIGAAYLGSPAHPGMDGILNFPLHNALTQVFVDGEPTALLSHRLNNAMTLYRDPQKLVNFVDNHDMDRIAARTDPRSVAGALTFLMTMPGIPALYYGTEQGFKERRATMFDSGNTAGGKNNFNTTSPTFTFLRELIALRKAHSALTRGDLTILADNKTGRGLFAFKRSYQGETLLIIFNTATTPVLMPSLATGLPGQTHLSLIASAEGATPATGELIADGEGYITEKIPPQSALVFLATKTITPGIASGASVVISSHGENDHYKKNFVLQGESSRANEISVVIDGDVSRPLTCNMDGLGTWQVEIPVTSMTGGVHQLAAYTVDGTRYVAAKPTYIFVENEWLAAGTSPDAIGDDRGPKGSYAYPTDSLFAHQCDIASLSALQSGTNLKLRITMANPLTQGWQPKFGFDHVSFSIFIDIPALRGQTAGDKRVMPFHNALLPENFTWNRMAFISGWSASLFSAEGADSNSYGKNLYPAPTVVADQGGKAIEIVLSARSLGDPSTLAGARIYVATWDYDGIEKRLRPLNVSPSGFGFSGGGPKDPLIMDDASVTIGQ